MSQDSTSRFVYVWESPRLVALSWCYVSEMAAKGTPNPGRRVLGSEFKPIRLSHPLPLHSALRARQWRSRAHHRRDFLSQLNSDLTFSPVLLLKMCSCCISRAEETRHLLLGILGLHTHVQYCSVRGGEWRLIWCTWTWVVKENCMYVLLLLLLIFCSITWRCGKGSLHHCLSVSLFLLNVQHVGQKWQIFCVCLCYIFVNQVVHTSLKGEFKKKIKMLPSTHPNTDESQVKFRNLAAFLNRWRL